MTQQETHRRIIGTPGKMLSAAREAAGMTHEEVATQLHLRMHIVRCLELDDFSEMAAPIYVRGYLRAYARLLNIPEQKIIEAYDENPEWHHKPAADPLLTTENHIPIFKSSSTPQRRTILIATGGFVILLVVLVSVWWNQHHVSSVSGTEPVTASTSSVTTTVINSAPVVIPATDSTSVPASEAGKPSTDTVPSQTVTVTPVAAAETKAPTVTTPRAKKAKEPVKPNYTVRPVTGD